MLGKSGSLYHLVHHLVLCTSLGRERKHSHARLCKACNALGSLCRAHCNLSQLIGIRSRGHCNISHHNNTILAVLRSLGNHQHCSANAADARSALDNLKCRTQGVSRGGKSSADLSVGISALDYETSEIQRVGLHQFLGLLRGHSLVLAQLIEQIDVLCSFL